MISSWMSFSQGGKWQAGPNESHRIAFGDVLRSRGCEDIHHCPVHASFDRERLWYLPTSSSILGSSSGIRKGLEITSSYT